MLTMTHSGAAVSNGGPAAFFTRIVETIARHRANRRVAEHLMNLDDHLLSDVGLTRGQVQDLLNR